MFLIEDNSMFKKSEKYFGLLGTLTIVKIF